MGLFKPSLTMIALTVLVGCNADQLEVNLKTDDLRDAAVGEQLTTSFEAEFSLMSELDDQQRAELDQMIATVEDFMEIDEFEIQNSDFGITLTVEGQMPVSASEVAAPYYVSVTESDIFGDMYRVELANGYEFERFQNAMQGINFMLAPNAVQPVKFKVRGEGTVLAPAVEIDGYTYLFYAGDIERRLTMNFSGGPFENTSGGFLISK